MNLEKYKCAIFDLDGTLLDSIWVWEKVDVDFLGKRGIPLTQDYIDEIKTQNFKTGPLYVIEKYGLPDTPEMIREEWLSMAREEYHKNIKLKSNAEKFLKMLKQRGYKLAIATSSTKDLFEECLKRNKVYELFDTFVETGEAKRGKEFPDVYEIAAKRCGVSVEECIVFEDILRAVKGAKMGGFDVVGVFDESSKDDENQMKKECIMYIRDFADLLVGNFCS